MPVLKKRKPQAVAYVDHVVQAAVHGGRALVTPSTIKGSKALLDAAVLQKQQTELTYS